MINLASPITAIPKVGPKYKVLLEKLEIYKVEDLLYHFPFRYDDFAKVKNIKDVVEGDVITIEATLAKLNNIFTRNGKKLTVAKAIDLTGPIEIIWFNQHYLSTALTVGKTYYFSGKVGKFNNKITLIAPEQEEKSDNSLNTARLVPVYPETASVTSRWLRARINDILSKETDLEEFLPTQILERNEFPKIDWAIKQIHFPENLENAQAAKERLSFDELFVELLNVEKRKSEWSTKLEGYIFKPHKKTVDEFIEILPFKLTDSQVEAVQNIVDHTTKTHPMNVLLEGDVGTGKTVVAVIASYLTHLNKLKTLYMAPTEILAKQHFQTFKMLLGEKLKIELATGSIKPKSNDWDILIGTHAILFNKEEYKDIGLVIIDEQHRFGVEQRGKILELGNKGTDSKIPHLLSMTATPIPRTLALTLYGDLSITTLKTHPKKKKKINTKVVKDAQRESAYKWVREKNVQCFIVCPLIEVSESMALENVKAAQHEFHKLQEGVFKDLNMGLLHGKMKPKEKEEIIEKFKSGEIQVLVSTPVIEVGIDVPEATVIVVESSERYGLASLHQLRGRVGRGGQEGFCFLCMSTESPSSYERLKHLETVNNGLELAEIDMRIRGTGDIFGTMQHGFKKFKIAELSNMKLLENAKNWAQEIYKEIDAYPKLKELIKVKSGEFVKNN